MICPNCGTNVDDRASFCPECGKALQAEPASPFVEPPRAPEPPRPTPAPVQNYGGPYRAPVTNRNIALYIFLSLITCGIFSLYWLYCIVTDLNTSVGDTEDTSGGMVILFSIITCGIYMYYWYYMAGKKVNKLGALNGKPQDNSLSILYLILSIVGLGIVNMALIQNELNQVAGY